MILWILLFLLVIAISFVLAIKSMKDYQEIPSQTGEDFALFLIRRTSALNPEVLNSIHNNFLRSNSLISFERLIKGDKSALVVYGARNVLSAYIDMLDLLELEDYTNIGNSQISAWEVGIKNMHKGDSARVKNYFREFPLLSSQEQFWWQVVLSAKKGKATHDKIFQGQLRAVVVSEDPSRRAHLTQILQNLAPDKFIKLPKAFSTEQITDFYKKRSFRIDESNPSLNTNQIIELLLI